MRQRWFSKRALSLHAGALVFVPGCVVAWWWQVTRAMGGNDLSYLYAVEWPCFALVGLYFWWSLVHTDPEQVGARAQRRMQAETAPAEPSAPRRPDDEDPELAAYNDHLAELAARGAKTWRRT